MAHQKNFKKCSWKRHEEIPQGKMFNPNLLETSHMT